MKTLENLGFSDVFSEYKKRTLGKNGLNRHVAFVAFAILSSDLKNIYMILRKNSLENLQDSFFCNLLEKPLLTELLVNFSGKR